MHLLRHHLITELLTPRAVGAEYQPKKEMAKMKKEYINNPKSFTTGSRGSGSHGSAGSGSCDTGHTVAGSRSSGSHGRLPLGPLKFGALMALNYTIFGGFVPNPPPGAPSLGPACTQSFYHRQLPKPIYALTF